MATSPTTNPVPSNAAADLLYNAEKLDEVMNTDAVTYEDRFGAPRMTVAGAVATLAALNERGDWAATTVYAVKDLAKFSGSWYMCVEPHTSGATFAGDADKWVVYQGGIRAADLADPANGDLLVAVQRSASGAVATDQDVINDEKWVQPKADYGALGTGAGNDTAALTALAAAFPGRLVHGSGRTYRITGTLPVGWRMIDGTILHASMVTAQDEYSVVAIGEGAGAANTYVPEVYAASGGRFFASGNHNVYIGWGSGNVNTTGRRNVAVGSRAMLSATTAYYTTAVGSHALEGLTTGIENTALGVQSGQATTTGYNNTFVGSGSGGRISVGFNNVAVGLGAGSANAVLANINGGNSNVWLGYRAGYVNETGTDNIGVGADAMVSLTTGSNNVAAGRNSLLNLTTGSGFVAVGTDALRNMVSNAAPSTALGYQAGRTNTGAGNCFFGYQVGLVSTSADNNCAFGYRAALALTTGDNNVLIGRSAGGAMTTDTGNTAIGDSALASAVGTSNNVAIGSSALASHASGDNNTAVGNGAGGATTGRANCTSLGNGATPTADNQVTLGNAAITTLRCQVTTITALSDARDKANISELESHIPDAFLDRVLTPFVYTWAMRDGTQREDGLQVGVIAQFLKDAQDQFNLAWLGLVDETNPDRLEATPGKLLPLVCLRAQRQEKRLRAIEAHLGLA
jgi:hypothetical protein